LPTPPLPK